MSIYCFRYPFRLEFYPRVRLLKETSGVRAGTVQAREERVARQEAEVAASAAASKKIMHEAEDAARIAEAMTGACLQMCLMMQHMSGIAPAAARDPPLRQQSCTLPPKQHGATQAIGALWPPRAVAGVALVEQWVTFSDPIFLRIGSGPCGDFPLCQNWTNTTVSNKMARPRDCQHLSPAVI